MWTSASGPRLRVARVVHRLRRVADRLLKSAASRLDFELVPRTMYSPIPQVPPADSPWWRTPHPMPGITLDLESQLAFLQTTLAPHLDGLPADFPLRNTWYEAEEARVLFAMIRHLRPRLVLELGSGHSTLVTNAALAANAGDGRPGTLVAVDPSPRIRLPEAVQHRVCRAEDLPLDEYLQLQAGDVLFLDTTHTVKLGSEVNHIVLNVLPRLAPGVVVHVHDVFLPYDYPRSWLARGTYLSEQYLLHAFLCQNPHYEVLLALHALVRDRTAAFRSVFPSFQPGVEPGPSAFWIRRL